MAMPADPRGWLQRPQPPERPSRSQGDARAKRVVVAPAPTAGTVAALAARLPASAWERRQVAEGTQGPRLYAFARHRVTLWKASLPERTVWRVSKRRAGAEASASSYSSNAPARTPRRTVVWRSGRRWAIEPCCAEGKTALGMAHYDVRTYPGWPHHMLTTMLAHFFLGRRKLRWGKKSSGADGIPATDHLGRGLPPADVDD
jgi:SRSO17 transposase